MRKAMAVVVFIVLATGCSSDNRRALSHGQVKSVWEAVSDDDTIRVRGIGMPPQGIKSVTLRRGLSRNSALSNGRFEALALLRGIKLTGNVTVGGLMEKDSHVNEIANQVILGMEEAQVEWTESPEDGCAVLLEIKRDKLEKMLTDAGAADASEAYRTMSEQAKASDSPDELAKLKARFPGIASGGN